MLESEKTWSKNLLVANFHLEFHNYTPPTYTRWKLKLNFFDVCHITYAGLLAHLDKWSLQYGRRELLPASFSKYTLLDPVLFLRSLAWGFRTDRATKERGVCEKYEGKYFPVQAEQTSLIRHLLYGFCFIFFWSLQRIFFVFRVYRYFILLAFLGCFLFTPIPLSFIVF